MRLVKISILLLLSIVFESQAVSSNYYGSQQSSYSNSFGNLVVSVPIIDVVNNDSLDFELGVVVTSRDNSFSSLGRSAYLNGLEQIYECDKNKYWDKDLSSKALCLNGSRLFLTQGKHLDNDSHYYLDGNINQTIDYIKTKEQFRIINNESGTVKIYDRKTSNSKTYWVLTERIDSFGNKVIYTYVRIAPGAKESTSNYHDWYVKEIKYKNKRYEFNYTYSYQGVILVDSIVIFKGNSELNKYKFTRDYHELNLIKIDSCKGDKCLEPITLSYTKKDYRGFNPNGNAFLLLRDKIWFDYKHVSSKYSEIKLGKNSKRNLSFIFKAKRDVYDFYDLNNEYAIDYKKQTRKIDERAYLLEQVNDNTNGVERRIKSYFYGDGYYDKYRDIIIGFDYIDEVSYPEVGDPITVHSEYEINGALGGYPKRIITKQNEKVFKEEINNYIELEYFSNKGKYNDNVKVVKLASSESILYDEHGISISDLLKTNEYDYVYDNDSNITAVLKKKSVSDYKNIVSNEVEHSVESNFSYGKNYYLPLEVEENYYYFGDYIGSIKNKYSYNKNKIIKSTFYENDNEILSTIYKYNQEGNVIKKTEVAYKNIYEVNSKKEMLPEVTEHYKYNGPLLVSKKDSLGHTFLYDYNYDCEKVSSEKDPNGLVTNYTYDDFCNLIESNYPDGSQEKISYKLEPESEILYSKKIDNNKSPSIIEYYNSKNEKVKEKKIGFSGEFYIKDYYKSDLEEKVSSWYKAGENKHWYISLYDPMKRLKEKIFPYGKVSYEYILNTIEKTDLLNHKVISTIDSKGNIVSVKQNGILLNLSSNFRGDVTKSGYNNFITENDYSISGFNKHKKDPHRGEEWLDYDSYGNITYSRLSNGVEANFNYDSLGRLIKLQRFGNDDKNSSETTHYTWDKANNGKLKLAEVKDEKSETILEYNIKSQLKEKIIRIDGRSFETKMSYDDVGRISSIEYPNKFIISRDYNNYGYFFKEEDFSGHVLWEIDSLDSFNRVTSLSYGNGLQAINEYDGETNRIKSMSLNGNHQLKYVNYSYDSNDNLISKLDKLSGEEIFYQYDNLDRIKKVEKSLYGRDKHTTETYSYDELGNITSYNNSKYKYNESSRLYYLDGNRYLYDLNGNVISNGRFNIEWGLNGKPNKIYNDINEVNFGYNYESRLIYKNSKNENTYYLDYGYQVLYKDETRIDTIYTGYDSEKYVSIVSDSKSSKLNYLHSDELGSIDIVTNDNGTVANEFHYSTFGEKELKESNKNDNDNEIDIGYTGHQEIDDFGLINMKGRIYDPSSKRFLSADPYLNDVYNLQSHNRYSYVLNNPLKYVDPTGFSEEKPRSSGGVFSEFSNWVSSTFNSIRNYVFSSASRTYYSFKTEYGRISEALGVAVDVLKPSGEELSIIVGTGSGTIFTPWPDEVVWAGGVVYYFGSKAPKAYEVGSAVYKTSKLRLINGRKPINYKYAGTIHPSGIRFTDEGFPDFSPYQQAIVESDFLTGNYKKDAAMANKFFGLDRTPEGMVWHHVEDGRTLMLIPRDIHKAAPHTGGAAVIRHKTALESQ